MTYTARANDPRPAGRRPGLHVVREASGSYGTLLGSLEQAVEQVVCVPADDLVDEQIKIGLAAIETAARRLQTCQTELVGARRDREARRAREANGGTGLKAERAARHAERQVEQDLTAELQWPATRSKGTVKAAKEMQHLGPAKDALRSGVLPREHTLILADVLKDLTGPERDAVERHLVGAGKELDPTSFRRLCDRTKAEHDTAAAQRDLDRLQARRRASIRQNPDGTHSLYATLAGVDAEILYAGIDAFRTKDARDEQPRSSEQRTADALVSMARSALDHGTETTEHGQPPHAMVVVDWTTLTSGKGVAELTWTGPVPVTAVRSLLDDCNVVRIVTGPDGLPIDVGRSSRTAPAGTWRAIVARDRHCTWRGCDAPPSMCQTAHMDRRWIEGGGTSHHEMALLCHRHHNLVDRRDLTGRIVDGRVVWTDENRRPPGSIVGDQTQTTAQPTPQPALLDVHPPPGRPPEG